MQLKARKFGIIKVEGAFIYWLEQRLEEGGRGVIMRWGRKEGYKEMTPPDISVRSKVHEYGGGDFCVHDGLVYYVDANDQQIYQSDGEGQARKITEATHYRFADLEYAPHQHRLLAVAEHHKPLTGGEDHPQSEHMPDNMLVYIGVSGEEKGGLTILSNDYSFYASPRLSPDGKTIAWLEWDLPHMPWETARLMISPLDPLNFSPLAIGGGPAGGKPGAPYVSDKEAATPSKQDTACFGPQWSKEGRLYFISDRGGNGQLFVYEGGEVKKVPHQDSTVDALRPLWVFGMEGISISPENEIYLSAYQKGEISLQKITSKEITKIKTEIKAIDYQKCFEDGLVGVITTDHLPATIALINTETGKITPLRSSAEGNLETLEVSIGAMKEIPTDNGMIYGLYYAPLQSQDKTVLGQEAKPPAIITIHGGPTAMVGRGLNAAVHLWTSLGFAVFEIDYRGSTGYGKAYRKALDGAWGVADVDDIIAAGRYLISHNLADPDKLIIEGGSSGGYTALMALAKTDIFKCAACNYPVTDLGQLLDITHKFEAGYIYALTGTTPETAKAALKERSILANVGKISSPVIFFQGLDDKVVPPVQPRTIYEALIKRGIPSKLIEFAGEGHGFRRQETLETANREKISFFKKVLSE